MWLLGVRGGRATWTELVAHKNFREHWFIYDVGRLYGGMDFCGLWLSFRTPGRYAPRSVALCTGLQRVVGSLVPPVLRLASAVGGSALWTW